MESDLYLIDGMGLIFRGHFAFIRNPLKTSKGFNVSAVYSFLSSILKIIEEEKATRILVAFDTDRATFRREIYSEYKAHRPPMPDELKEQVPYVLSFLKAMHIPVLQMQGFEADDIIGTLAVRTAKNNGKAYILSKDKDFSQLVNANIILIDPKMQGEKTIRSGVQEILEKFGVGPESMIDYLALVGDASDNVPGVPKVGPKTACELISKFGNLENIYASLDKIPQKGLKKNLEENQDKAFMSRKLVTIKTDMEIPEDSFEFGPIDNPEYRALLKEMEFGSLLKASEIKEKKEDVREKEYKIIDNEPDLIQFVKTIDGVDTLSLDTETTDVDVQKAVLVGISLSIEETKAVYIPIAHETGKNIPLSVLKKHLCPILEKPSIIKTGHNLKFDLAVLKNHGIEFPGPFFDTMVAAYVINPGVRQYGLDALVLDRFSCRMQAITELIGEKKKDQIPFSKVEIGKAGDYSCADADLTLRLKNLFEVELKDKALDKLFYDIEMPLLHVLLSMESAGIKIDAPVLNELSLEYDKILFALEKEIKTKAGREFNINSPKQLQEILFNELKIKPLRKLKTGFSTDSDVLEALSVEHEIPRLILQHRKYSKLKSTYIDALPLAADKNGLVHTSFNQTITATGRLSSSNPNIQNIPVRSEEGRELRKAFIPRRDGNVLISADYSQIELRILAHVTGEEVLIDAFRNNEDIHRKTASLLLGIIPSLVSHEQRAIAKTVNFGIIYGQGAFSLSQQLHISAREAGEFIDNYFLTYPRIKRYMDSAVALAREKGYVETLYGRRRYLPEINSDNRQMRSFAERIAINAPIQGTAADLIKIAMINIMKKIDNNEIPGMLLLQVHDELVLEASEKDAGKVLEAVKVEMEGAADLSVPLKVEAGSGKNWLEAH